MTTQNLQIKMVDTVGQYHKIKEEIDRGIIEILESGAYINGPAVGRFAGNLSAYLDGTHVIPCANGTDALQVALMALDLKPGDEVITPSFTFIATAEVIALLGLKPVFVDSDPGTFNISPAAIEKAITPRTRCIIPVHLFGQSADMEAVMEIAGHHNLFVVEDNAQAIGSEITFSDGTRRKAGTIGHIGCTSFYPSKNLGAYGDAGAIFTKDADLAQKIRTICSHGSKIRYYHIEIGVNSRLDSIQAHILDVKLKHLDEYTRSRQWAAAEYDKHFSGVPGILIPARAKHSTHVFHQYTLRIEGGREKRDALKKKLEEKGIPAMVYYPVPLHLQEAYKPYGTKQGEVPVSEMLCEQVISLPMHSELDAEQIGYVGKTLIESLRQIS